MADKKIITDELLKLQTEKVLQVIADNVYQEEEYLEQEIDDMFDATPQEISYYESLINPDVVSENRLWSSKTIDEKLASAILEANKYTDQASTRNLTTEIVSSTADVTKENVLYLILSDASTNTYEQYMLIGGAATALGSTQVDLSNIYNKSEVDTKLDDKANKSEVLSMDSVQATTGSETNDTVYTSKLTKDELDKKANDGEVVKKTDISTTIDKTSTDDTVPTNKAVYDSAIKDKRLKTYSISSADDFPDLKTLLDIGSNLPSNSIAVIDSGQDKTSFFGLPSDKFEIVWVRRYSGRDSIMAYTATGLSYICTNIKNQTWKRVCTTSVADVPVTDVTFASPNVSKARENEVCKYCVKNGVCYVTLNDLLFSSGYKSEEGFVVLPKPAMRQDFELTDSLGATVLGKLFLEESGAMHLYTNTTPVTATGYISFSYPVAE